MKTVIRVFPRKTKATPDDENVRVNCQPGMFDEADEVHISVAFEWDLKRAEILARQWSVVAPVKIGGPATGEKGEAFISGRYVKKGYVITSRGCPNKCWFCSVWKREGGIRELPITEGWNLLDDNILACSDQHINAVFEMLGRQKKQGHQIEFTGGLEAARLKPWHADELFRLKPKQLFFAYDTPDDYEPLLYAGNILRQSGFKLFPQSHRFRCYVLIGYPKDTLCEAEKRLFDTIKAGFMPMAMLWRTQDNSQSYEWRNFQRKWARPAIISSNTTRSTK
jgi:hypothetical protein